MTLKKIDYSNTIIYKIVCNDLSVTDCYVGNTTQFRQRKSQHKKNCNNSNSKNLTIHYTNLLENMVVGKIFL